MKKILMSMLSVVVSFAILLSCTMNTFAAVGDNSKTEVESNNTTSLADRIYNDYTVTGSVSQTDLDYYKFTLSSTATVSVTFTSKYSTIYCGIYNSSETVVKAWKPTLTSSGNYAFSNSVALTPGTYYILVISSEASSLNNTYAFYFEYETASHTHSYSNSCDSTCNSCGAVRTVYHSYSNSCDDTCNICYATRIVAGHGYSNNCDATCDVCGEIRTPYNHVYTDNCDAYCNECNAERVAPHVYTNNCDTECDVCLATRTAPHSYDNNCDTVCNDCGEERTITHNYTNYVTQATLSEDGVIVKKCSVCGDIESTTAINYVKSFALTTTSYTYSGAVRTPGVIVKDSAGKTLVKNTDYTVSYASGRVNAGTYKVTVTMKGNYSGSKTLTFKINPISYSKCKFALTTTNYTYNGGVKTPGVTVKYGSTTLKKNTDYTVSYASGRKNAGTYKVTVTMKGNYSGTKTLTFKINPISYSKCKFALTTTNYMYNKGVRTPGVTVKYGSTTLKKNTDYTVSYASGRKNVGVYKVTVKMKGNYTGSKVLTFNIKPTTKSAVNLLVGAASSIGAKSNKGITYKSSNTKIATVNSKGVITAKKAGTAIITVTSNKVSQKITVKVTSPYVKIAGTKSLLLKQAVTLKATTNTGIKAKWSSSNKKVATVSSSGKVTGLGVGSATIYAKITYKGKTYTGKFAVTVKKPYLAKTSATIDKGKTYTISVKGGSGTITYSSSNKKVATVSSKGVIKGVGKGSATITVKRNGYSMKFTVKVQEKKYGAGETWTVSNKFSVKIKSVEKHYKCDDSYDTTNFKNAVIIHYEVKNLGISDKLLVDEWCFDVYDNNGQEGDPLYFEIYCDHGSEMGNVLVGGKGTASLPIAVGTSAGKVTICLEVQGYKATFVVPVTAATSTPEEDKLNGCKITLDSSLPATYSYYRSNSLQSSCQVTAVEFEVSGDDLKIYFTGRKTYDSRGSGQSDTCKISWKLYDDTNTVIDSGTAYTTSIATGEGFKRASSTAYNCITPGGKYTLKLLNTN